MCVFVGSCLASSPSPLRGGERAWVHTVCACVDILRKFAVKYSGYRRRHVAKFTEKRGDPRIQSMLTHRAYYVEFLSVSWLETPSRRSPQIV